VTRSPFIAAALAALLCAGITGSVAASPAIPVQDVPRIPEGRKPTEMEKKAAGAAIEAQLKAFKADDYATAMKYQSAALRENFESADEFRVAIKRGYPQFANYKSVTFGEAAASKDGERIVISITLTGQDGVIVKAIYAMIKEQGEYKVDGVFPEAKPKTAPRDVV
jgi:hypothetical protein